MHVFANRAQVAVAAAVHDERLVTPAEEMAREPVPAIEPAGVGAKEPFHARHEIGLWRFHHEMKMIGHETPAMNLPAGLPANFAQGFEEAEPVLIIAEDDFTAVSAIEDVVNGSWVLDS